MKSRALGLIALLGIGCQRFGPPIPVAGSDRAVVVGAVISAKDELVDVLRLDGAGVPLALDPSARIAVWTLPREALIDPDGAPISDSIAAGAATHLENTPPLSGSCGRCLVPALGATQVVNPGDRCAPPRFAAAEMFGPSGPITADASLLETLRTQVRLDWPGTCPYDASPPAGSPSTRSLTTCPIAPAEAPWAIDQVLEGEDGTIALVQQRYFAEIAPDERVHATVIEALSGRVLALGRFPGPAHSYLAVAEDHDRSSSAGVQVYLLEPTAAGEGLSVTPQRFSGAESQLTASIRPVPGQANTLDLIGSVESGRIEPQGLRCTRNGPGELSCARMSFESGCDPETFDELFLPGGAIVASRGGSFYFSRSGSAQLSCDVSAALEPPIQGVSFRSFAATRSNLVLCGDVGSGSAVVTASIAALPSGDSPFFHRFHTVLTRQEENCTGLVGIAPDAVRVSFNNGEDCTLDDAGNLSCAQRGRIDPERGDTTSPDFYGGYPGSILALDVAGGALYRERPGATGYEKLFGPKRSGYYFDDYRALISTSDGFIAADGHAAVKIRAATDCRTGTIADAHLVSPLAIEDWPSTQNVVRFAPLLGSDTIVAISAPLMVGVPEFTSEVGLIRSGPGGRRFVRVGALAPQSYDTNNIRDWGRRFDPVAVASLAPLRAVLATSGGRLYLLDDRSGEPRIDAIPMHPIDGESGAPAVGRDFHWRSASAAGGVAWIAGEDALARVTLSGTIAEALVFLLDRIPAYRAPIEPLTSGPIAYSSVRSSCADRLLFGGPLFAASSDKNEPLIWEIAPLGRCGSAGGPFFALAGEYTVCAYTPFSLADSTTSSNQIVDITGGAPTFVFDDGVIWRRGFRARTTGPFRFQVRALENDSGLVLISGRFGRLALAIPQ